MNEGDSSFGEGAEEVVRRARAIGDDAAALASAVRNMTGAARNAIDLDRRMREQPAQTLLIAAGVGYILGGGFFTPFTGKMLRLGTRLWLVPTLKKNFLNRQEQELH